VKTTSTTETLSVSDAVKRGLPGLARAAEGGSTIVVERNHQPVAAIIGAEHYRELQEAERDLRDLSIVLIRSVTDTGSRTSLDDSIVQFGFSRDDLERELDEDLTAGRE
jgi:prevent-host-death family protein